MSVSSFYSDVLTGIDHIWSNRFDEAEDFFKKNAKTKPRHALYYAEIYVFRSFITEDDSDRHLALERLNATITLAESHIKSYEKGHFPLRDSFETQPDQQLIDNYELDTKIVLADACTMLSAFLVLEESRVKGALSLRRGWKTYEQTLKDVEKHGGSDHFDPAVLCSLRFGAGLFFVIVSLIPPGFAQKAAQWIGFRADKELGLAYLNQAYSTPNSIRSVFAGMVIAINNVLLTPQLDKESSRGTNIESEKIIAGVIEKYPNGSLPQVVGALVSNESNGLATSLKRLDDAISNCKHITSTPPIFFRVLSNCYLADQDYQSCADVLQKMLALSEENIKKKGKSMSPWSDPWNRLKLGAVYVQLDRLEESLKLWQIVSKGKEHDKWTGIIIKQSKKFLRMGGHLSYYEVLFLTSLFDKTLNACDNDEKVAMLNHIEEMAKKSPNALQKLTAKDFEKATGKKSGGLMSFVTLGYYGSADENNPALDNRALYLLSKGIVLRSLGRYEEAMEAMNEVISYKSHFNDKLYLAQTFLELGKCYAKTNNQAEAVKQWKEGIKLSGYPWEDATRNKLRLFINQAGEDVEIIDENSNDDESLKKAEEQNS